MATSDETVVDALDLEADGDVTVSVESDAGGQLVRVESSSGRVSLLAYIDETATNGDVATVTRDFASEAEYHAGDTSSRRGSR